MIDFSKIEGFDVWLEGNYNDLVDWEKIVPYKYKLQFLQEYLFEEKELLVFVLPDYQIDGLEGFWYKIGNLDAVIEASHKLYDCYYKALEAALERIINNYQETLND